VTASPTAQQLVSGPEALAEFRRGLTSERLFEQLVAGNGRLLITLSVGVGKTEVMVKAIVDARTLASEFDLVVALVPRRDILEEIRRRLPLDTDPVVLDPRPRRRCGSLDVRWRELSRATEVL
jgi:late competence protein required for DNA uptake (superfamily II DNA/RNA helicase)